MELDMALSVFFPSVTGLDAQSTALGSVSDNIANIRTTGYKAADTLFYTLLGSQPISKNSAAGISSSRADVSGVGTYTRYNILQAGEITSTGNVYDVALEGGNAFFMVTDEYGQTYYTRAGDFDTLPIDGKTALVNHNGYAVQGFQVQDDGTFAQTPSDVVLAFEDHMPSIPTSDVEITANVPASGVNTSTYGITVYGPNNDGATMNMIFNKNQDAVNTWNVSFAIDGAEVVADPIEAKFSTDGKLVSPQVMNVTVNWEDGTSNTIAIDVSNMTQYDGGDGEVYVSQDGAPGGDLVGSYIDSDGILKAEYTNNRTLNVAKLAVVSFQSPENLVPVSGTLFEAYSDVGNTSYVIGPDTVGNNLLRTQSLEGSNVNLEQEFSELIQVQRAYNLNSNAFTVANEMTSVAIDLKS